MRYVLSIAAMLIATFGSRQAVAWPRHPVDYLFVAQMPTVDQVRQDVRGDTSLDTDGRQHAAFVLLGNLVDVSGDGKGVVPWPARERELKNRYSAPLGKILGNDNAFDRHDLTVFELSLRYRADPAFTRPFLTKYFSPAAMSELEPILVQLEKGAADAIARGAHPQGASERQALGQLLAQVENALPETLRPLLYVPAIVWQSLLVIWIAWLIVRALPFRLEGAHPLQLQVGRRRYSMRHTTGRVLKIDRTAHVTTSTTYHSVQDANGSWRSIPSTSVQAHRQFRAFIQPPNAPETAITLSDTDLPVREGHRLAGVWAVEAGETSGYYLFFHIYDMRRTQTMPFGIEQVVRPRCRAALLIAVASFWLGYSAPSPLLLTAPWLPFAFPVVCLIAYATAMSAIRRRRKTTFTTHMIDRILGAIGEAESARQSGALQVSV